MPWWGWLIIGILAFLIAAIVVLFIFGRRMQRKQADTEKQMEAMKQQVSILVIDKQKKRMIDSGLPDAVIQQTPKYARRMKVPLVRAKIGPRTKIVSAVHVSNVLGVANDVKLMAQVAHENGAVMIVDGAQSVPHFPVDVTDLDCDFFAFSGHKVFGPMGIGVLWGRHELLDAMPPFLTGGEMIDAVSEQDATWAPVPEKFEAGTQDAAGIYALDAALTYVENVGFDAMQAREGALVAQCMRRLGELEFVRLIGPSDPALHHGVVSFNVCGIHPHDVASILDMDGVAIRAGHHCAQPLLAHLGIDSCCRASFAFYNDSTDIDRLIDGLQHVWRMFNG